MNDKDGLFDFEDGTLIILYDEEKDENTDEPILKAAKCRVTGSTESGAILLVCITVPEVITEMDMNGATRVAYQFVPPIPLVTE